jgi:hypothetical protein
MTAAVTRPMDALNTQPPGWVAPLLLRRPACYSPEQWVTYIGGVRVDALTDNTLRKSLDRGRMPNFCIGCTPNFRDVMQAAGKCCPAHADDLAAESSL